MSVSRDGLRQTDRPSGSAAKCKSHILYPIAVLTQDVVGYVRSVIPKLLRVLVLQPVAPRQNATVTASRIEFRGTTLYESVPFDPR